MPDSTPAQLPILSELGDQLADAYSRHERRGRAWRKPLGGTRALTASLAALLAAAVLVVALLTLVPHSRYARSAAAPALIRLADVARAQPSSFPTNRQFTYTKSLTTTREVIRREPETLLPLRQAAGPKATVTVEDWVWTSAARMGAARFHVVSVKFPSAAARRLWERDGRPSFAPPGSGRVAPIGRDRYLLGDIELSRRALLRTTTDPRRLYDELYRAGHSAAGEVFTEITDTLRDRPAPPRLRAALFRALALVPGVRLLGARRDSLHREGTAFVMHTGDVQSEVIVDPATSQTLEERTLVSSNGAGALGLPAGTVVSTTTYLARAITNTIRTP